jgi:hypothetical protein
MPTTTQLTVDLQWREDRFHQKFLAGVIEFPANLDLSKGLVVLVWPHEENSQDYPMMAIKPRVPRTHRSGKPRQDPEEQEDMGDSDPAAPAGDGEQATS